MPSRNQNSRYGYRSERRNDSQQRSAMDVRSRDFDEDDYLTQNHPTPSSLREQNRQDFRTGREDDFPSSQFNDQDRSSQNWRYGRGQGSSYRLGANQGAAYGQSMNSSRFDDDGNVRSDRENFARESRLAYSSPDYTRTNRGFEGYGNGLGSQRPLPVGATEAEVGRYAGIGPKNYKRSDERIKEEINENLTRHYDIDASDVEVEVKDGDVTITGSVPQRRMKHLVEDLIDQSFGVTEIINQLRVKRSLTINSEETSSSTSANKSGKKSPSSPFNPNH